MGLKKLLEDITADKLMKEEVTEDRIQRMLPQIRNWIAFWREYPDLFVDFLCGSNPQNFSLFFYQRLFLRAALRHRYMYATFPRAWSKSFMSVLALMLRCILYPHSHLFVTTGGKEQAARITKEKADELCRLIPRLGAELDLSRGQTKTNKDNLELIFKNGSRLDIVAAKASSRGVRATGGLIEECILVDQQILNEVIIPTMNVDRRLSDGSYQIDETVNKSQIYVKIFSQC